MATVYSRSVPNRIRCFTSAFFDISSLNAPHLLRPSFVRDCRTVISRPGREPHHGEVIQDRAVEITSEIIKHLVNHGPAGGAETARTLDQPKNTVHDYLQSLVT